jgi:hypothetical protein
MRVKAMMKVFIATMAILVPFAILEPIAASAGATAVSNGAAINGAAISEGSPAPVPKAQKFTHKFTLHRNGATTTETCVGYVNINKSSKYPGYIAGIAYVEGCAPIPDVSCAQTADIQIMNPYTGVWDADGDGPTTHGCAERADASIRRNSCSATGITVAYRTMGIYVVIDAAGDVLAWHGPSGKMTVLRVC